MSRMHFTAWLVNIPSALDQANMDITISQDQLVGANPDNDSDWTTDTSKPTPFYAVTHVNATTGDITEGIKEAEALMQQDGWKTTSNWQAVTNAYTATVERT